MPDYWIHVNGRTFRLTVGPAFSERDTEYVTVDCRDIATRMESQAILTAEEGVSLQSMLTVRQLFDCVVSVYGNATGDWSPRDAFTIRMTSEFTWNQPPDPDEQ